MTSPMEVLPMELLDRVLGRLSDTADLIACRKVCRRWRAAVDDIRHRDLAHAFRCGVDELENVFLCPDWSDTFYFLWGLVENTEHLASVWYKTCLCGGPFPLRYSDDNDEEDQEAEGGEDEDEEDSSAERHEHVAEGRGHDDDATRERQSADIAGTAVKAAENGLKAVSSPAIAKRLTSEDSDADVDNNGATKKRKPDSAVTEGVASADRPQAPDRRRGVTWYGRVHAIPRPLGRWAVLEAERDLAYALAVAASVIEPKTDVLKLTVSLGSFDFDFSGEWLPTWQYIPSSVVLPTTIAGMRQFASDLFSATRHSVALAQLSDASTAAAYYAAAELGWPQLAAGAGVDFAWKSESAWATPALVPADAPRAPPFRDGAAPSHAEIQTALDELKLFGQAVLREHWLYGAATNDACVRDVSGWAELQLRPRQSAASWRLYCALGWTPWLRAYGFSLQPDDAAHQEFLDAQVGVTDTVKAVFASHGCRLPLVVRIGHCCWLGGLSPRGHLVGVWTEDARPDGDLIR